MAQLKFSGPIWLRCKSFVALNAIAIATFWRHKRGRPLTPDWDANLEIGIRFWRYQFTQAMGQSDMSRGRLLFDSVQMETDEVYDVTVEPCTAGGGQWYRPNTVRSKATLLYFHGGGYTFHGAVSKQFAMMLAHHTGAVVYAPEYRLTPEHKHPAQKEDALEAWKALARDNPPEDIVVVGDSAGGHMALMLLQTLKDQGLEQPALCIGLCPWTDIGDRGVSLVENDKYDLVQGWMALQFGIWLDPDNRFGRAELSPISYDFSGLAPIYLQAGGREVLRDMILEFARTQKQNGAEITLDVWDDMAHDFQIYDSLKASSTQALQKIVEQVHSVHRLS